MTQLDPRALDVAAREWLAAIAETTPRRALECALRAYLGALCHAHVRQPASPASYRLRTGQTIAGLHPEEVEAARAALERHGGTLGPGDDEGHPDALAHALAAAAGWRSRREAEERAHARLRDDPVRLADLAECMRRAAARVEAIRTAADDAR